MAPAGGHGKGKNMHGKNGENIILNVPVGTIVKNIDSGKLVCDFKNDNEEIVVAKGGNGGFGNARFKTQNNPAPRNSNDGEEGVELNLELELKIIADVGLVGFPNAGKSTYISSISNAKPKIADYPFTTLYPNLGIVKYGSYNSFTKLLSSYSSGLVSSRSASSVSDLYLISSPYKVLSKKSISSIIPFIIRYSINAMYLRS